jgi:hypothetical protein
MNQHTPNYAAALDFIKEAGTMKGYLDTLDVTYQQILERIKQINGGQGDKAVNVFKFMLKKELAKEMDMLEAILADVYASRFSASDLQQLKDFFRTAVGQKLIMETTAIAQDFAEKSTEFQEKMATVIMPKIQMEFKMQGFKM